MRLQIEVTERDIRLGTPEDSTYCPIARSVKRKLGLLGKKAERLWVLQESVEFDTIGEGIRWKDDWWEENTLLATLPAAAVKFMSDFDNKRPVKPFSFFAVFNKTRTKSVGLTLPTA